MLEQSQNRELIQLSWNFMNDSLKSDIFMRYTPDQIGCACIWISARIKKIVLPEHPPWYELLDCTKDICEEVSRTILDLYCIPRPNTARLDRVLNAAKEAFELKKSFNEKNKKDLKELQKTATPNSFSPAIDNGKKRDSPSSKPSRVSPKTVINNKLSRMAENGSSDHHMSHHKNGGRSRKHHSPRRRYSPVSPLRRKHDRYSRKKHRYDRSSSDSENGSLARERKRKHRSKRRPSSSSSESSESSDNEAVREEARKRRHEEKKRLADQKKLQEKIRQLEKENKEKERTKKDKLIKDSGKDYKHKVR